MECGKLLMDDDIYEGDSYEGVAWFCDGCGALLNRQSGFSDGYEFWVCTECGHRNGTTEDDILEEDDDPKCSKCGTYLKKQFCFFGYEEDWECTECGAYLHRDLCDNSYAVVNEDHEEDNDCDVRYVPPIHKPSASQKAQMFLFFTENRSYLREN